MGLMRLGITDYLDCAHLLPGHVKCGRLHGHTYRVQVAVEGEMRDGMVVDFADLKSQVRAVFARYDHRHWNDFLDYPSVENICERLAEELAERLAFRFTIRVYEGHGKWAETTREPRASGGTEA
jgi:6-pyruvoyltetrahydropterin/6-carboxytetrahydropterin synthase